MTRSGRASTSLLSDADLFLFDQGTHYRLYDKLGAHLDSKGAQFAVWAPAARSVSVIGGFNGWDPRQAPLHPRGNSGIWEGHVSGVRPGAFYKYHIASRIHGYSGEVADPFAVRAEEPPATGSVVWPLDYDWGDDDWMSRRHERQRFDAPLSIYELHLGSWMCPHDGQRRHFGYRELAPLLADYVRRLGFTHVQLLPVMEHPFYGSWGYQTTGYYAPTARYGSPQDFMFLVDHLHQCGIGVILDWVPSHFPGDGHALGFFDGTHLFEHADPRKGFHPDWNSLIFNYGRGGVRSFLISSAMFWLNR